MDTFGRVGKWLASWLAINEETITPQSTLGDLYRSRRSRPSLEDEPTSPIPHPGGTNPDSLDLMELVLALEEAFDLEFSDAEAEALNETLLDRNTAVQQIVAIIDRA